MPGQLSFENLWRDGVSIFCIYTETCLPMPLIFNIHYSYTKIATWFIGVSCVYVGAANSAQGC